MKKPEIKVTRSVLKRQSIIDSAKKVFLKQGYKNVSMDQVAELASVSKKTVYHHFANKEKLFQAVLVEHWGEIFLIKDKLFHEQQSPTANLKIFAKVFLEFLYQQDTIDLFRLLISESNQFPDLVENLLVDDKAPFTKALIDYLKVAKKNGTLKIVDAERAASYFMGLLKEYHFWPMMLGFTKKRKPPNITILVEEAVHLFVKFYE